MQGLDLFADEIDGRLYAAVTRRGKLVNLYVDGINTPAPWATMYLGKVIKVDTKLDAAIVDLGNGQSGMLAAKHVKLPGEDTAPRAAISELLKGGQMVMVQVKSEGKAGSANENQKLARLTMKLYVPGWFLAYSPYAAPVTISKKVYDENVLALAQKLEEGKGSWIVQYGAQGAAESDVMHEVQCLREKWRNILIAKEAAGGKPGVVMKAPDAIFRAIADNGVLNFEHIYMANKQLLDRMIGFCNSHLPSLATSKRLRLFKPEKLGQKLFDIDDIYGELEMLKDQTVHLPCGGSIIIEHTAALTMIDVNQGSASNISMVNQEAAHEVARQCRLRSLSGAILVDFINMDQKVERSRLLDTLNAAFADDAGSAQVHGFTRLGIIEITRKRRGATLAEKIKKQALSL